MIDLGSSYRVLGGNLAALDRDADRGAAPDSFPL